MGHHNETVLMIVCLLAFGPAFLLHHFVRRFFPPVVVQIFFGVLIGPTFLGLVSPEAYAFISSPQILFSIKFVGTIAVAVFAFAIGMHINAKEFQGGKDMRSLMLVSGTSLIVPFLVGLPVGYYFGGQERLLGAIGTASLFAFAYAILNSVTALPVLAAMTDQMGYKGQRVGKVALFSATIGDGALWLGLAIFMAWVAAKSDGTSSLLRLCGWAVLYVFVMWYGVKRVLQKFDGREMLQTKRGALTVALTVAFASALATHLIGLHLLLGAVFAGMIIPDGMKKKIEEAMGNLNEDILLPFFFISTGMATLIPFSADPLFWGLAIGSTVLTIATKLWPTAYVAVKTGLLSPLDAHKLGAFMAAKGLMEIVVLTIMRDAGVISVTTFGAMIVMALLTTALTMPMVMLFRRWYAPGPYKSKVAQYAKSLD